MLLGAHVSIAGGYPNAVAEAKRLKMQAIQIFTKNQRYWREKVVSKEEASQFSAALKDSGVRQVFSHAIYLISLGSQDEEIVEKSVASLIAEVRRCSALGLTHTVLHPGAAGSMSPEQAILRIGDNIKKVISETKGKKVKILIENTAGSGTSVGGRMEYIADLIDHISSPRIGVCIDTCHAFAAGYDIRGEEQMEKFLGLIDRRIGLRKLLCFHLNDSKGGLGSRLDRHAHIGEGQIGTGAFRYIVRHFPNVPKVIETPKEGEADRRNLALLRKLALE